MIEDYGRLYREIRLQHPGVYGGIPDEIEAQEIKRLVDQVKPLRLLDYGSGAGHQYLVYRQHEVWGGPLPHCYDPGIVGMDMEPAGRFQGVICTDVLEHIAREDLPAVLDHMADFLDLYCPCFVYLKISCLPARKKLPDGRNVHLTIEPPQWWDELLKGFFSGSACVRTHRRQVLQNVTLKVTYEI